MDTFNGIEHYTFGINGQKVPVSCGLNSLLPEMIVNKIYGMDPTFHTELHKKINDELPFHCACFAMIHMVGTVGWSWHELTLKQQQQFPYVRKGCDIIRNGQWRKKINELKNKSSRYNDILAIQRGRGGKKIDIYI